MRPLDSILYLAEPRVDQSSSIARAAALARSSQACLKLVDVVPDKDAPGAAPEGLRDALRERIQSGLEALLEPHAEGLVTSVEVLEGPNRFIEAIRSVLRERHDLLVKPAENPDWIRRLFGSEDMHLLRKCPCPVWIMKPGEGARYRKILAAVDFDPDDPQTVVQGLNGQILDLAAGVALSDLAALHVAHAWEAPEAGFVDLFSEHPGAASARFSEGEYLRQQTAMGRLMDKLRGELGEDAWGYLKPQSHVAQGQARRVIPTLARELGVDLVVMGTVARTGIPGLIIGNTAESILDQLTCSVLAVKPDGFVSPVEQAS